MLETEDVLLQTDSASGPTIEKPLFDAISAVGASVEHWLVVGRTHPASIARGRTLSRATFSRSSP